MATKRATTDIDVSSLLRTKHPTPRQVANAMRERSWLALGIQATVRDLRPIDDNGLKSKP